MVRRKPKPIVLKISEAFDEQGGSGQQNDRERDFSHYKEIASRAIANRSMGAPATFAKGII